MKITITILGFLLCIINQSNSQTSTRIEDIKKLYKEYNSDLKYKNEFKFTYFEEGDEFIVKIHTDYSGKILLKTIHAGEFHSWENEFYFRNDSIQFIFSEHIFSDHWMNDTVKFKIEQNRYYFEDLKVIKQLTKTYNGIEGVDNKKEINNIPNVDATVQADQWEDKLIKIIKLYKSLETAIKLTGDTELFL